MTFVVPRPYTCVGMVVVWAEAECVPDYGKENGYVTCH